MDRHVSRHRKTHVDRHVNRHRKTHVHLETGEAISTLDAWLLRLTEEEWGVAGRLLSLCSSFCGGGGGIDARRMKYKLTC